MQIRLRVARGDGSAGAVLREYAVQVAEEATVLDALEAIRHGEEPGLAYRHSCHHGSCGTCACRINGRERLACGTRVADLDAAIITVEPLRAGAVVADLVVERRSFFGAMPADVGYLRPSEVNAEATPAPGGGGFVRFENCIECGACVSACPVEAPFIGPAALAALNRRRQKHPEAEQDVCSRAAAPDGAMVCERALECSRVCPTGVYPARHIAELRRLVNASS
jgi:succinate dehydrogenase / fumarate reductase, iron-sulfur subunit